jgi:hypothetical protein
MENVRNRINFQLVHDGDKISKLASKIKYKDHGLYGDMDNELCGISMAKTNITLDKPIYVGMAILDLSKTLMYDFHYNTILKKYSYKDVKLLFTDTDSLCYHIKTEDIYKDIESNKNDYDLSDYPKDHFLYDDTNKKVIGKFKDECSSIPISEFVGLRSKLYAFQYAVNGKTIEKKTCKGIKQYVVKKNIKFQNYKDALFVEGKEQQYSSMNCIRSKNHKLISIKINKIGVSCFDNKRYIQDDNINTLAHGHYLTR